MRDSQSEKSRSENISFAKSEAARRRSTLLGDCLLDSDAETMRLLRRNRRKSLALSTLLEAGLLTAAVVVPLFASHALPLVLNDPPIPPPRGIRLVSPPQEKGPTHTATGSPRPSVSVIFTPPRIPQDVRIIDDRNEAPAVGAFVENGTTIGDPNGIANLPGWLPDLSRRPAPTPVVAESKPRGPVKVSPGVQEAKLIYRVQPVYPPIPKQLHKEGRVELQAIIAADGTIQELKAVSGDPWFIQSALDAVRQWRYQPTLLGNQPVEVQTHITVIYVLSNN